MILNFDKAHQNLYIHKEVVKVVTNHFGMDINTLEDNPRKRGDIATARKYACYLLKKYCKEKTLKEIGEIVGYKNKERHATVLYHLRDIDNKIPIYNQLKVELGILEKSIEKHFEFVLELEGYTVKDAIKNPKILERYKRQEGVKR